jgi:isopentenyl-diphosphate delta-isomerase
MAGFVRALGRDRMVLRVTQAIQTGAQASMRITVCLEEGTSYAFSGQWSNQTTDENFLVAAADLPLFSEMMSQLRKDQHIEICRREDVEASDRFTGFERLSFRPEALPLVDESQLDLSQHFLGRKFDVPLLITGMTGGISKGAEINRRLALAAAEMNIPMGVGSQRLALESPDHASIFRVKQHAPNLFLIGNIGIAQLTQANALSLCQRAVDMIEADALAIHFNLIQELVQIEGDRNFSGLLKNLEQICQHLSVPVIAKEVGCGMSPQTVGRFLQLGFAAVDIGGRGGTSWSRIEGLRSQSALSQNIGDTFRNWGAPTAYSLATVRHDFPGLPLIATGGIRDGVTVAKAVALGANLVGIGLPLLRAALISEEAVLAALDEFRQGLKISLLATGSVNLAELSRHLVLGHPLEREFDELMLGV